MELTKLEACLSIEKRLKKLRYSDKVTFLCVFGDFEKEEDIIVQNIIIFRLKDHYFMDLYVLEVKPPKTNTNSNKREKYLGYKYELSDEGINEILEDIFSKSDRIFMDIFSVAEVNKNTQKLWKNIQTILKVIFDPTIPKIYTDAMYMSLLADRFGRIETYQELYFRCSLFINECDEKQIEKENKVIRRETDDKDHYL